MRIADEFASSSDLGARAFFAARWSAGGHILNQSLAFGIGLALMRLLSPDPYGILGMAAVVTGFMGVIGNLGFGPALVQRRALSEHHMTGVFWASIGLGSVLFALAFTASPLVGRFYRESMVVPVLRVLALVFVVGAIAATPKALLQRRMAFREIAKLEVTATVFAGGGAILLAWKGAGVWSLVARTLAGPAVEALGVWFFLSWRPTLRLSLGPIKDLAGYGLSLTGFNLVNYWARRADDLLIGRVMGAPSLGLYNRAYSMMLLPITQIIGMISRVMFPTLSALQDDPDRMRTVYLRVVRVIAFLSFPLMAGLAVLADAFVIGVLGEQWRDAVPVIQILCLVGVIQTLSNPTGWIYTATGRTDWMLWWGVGSGIVLIAGIVVGVVLGSIRSVAWGYAGANLALLYPVIAIPGRLIRMRFADVLAVVWRTGLVSIGMLLALALVRVGFLDKWSHPAILSLLVPLGGAIYAGASLTLNRPTCAEVLSAVERILPGSAAAAGRLRDTLRL